jgi:integration host factor subunit beta
MNKQDLSGLIAKNNGISKAEATRCINMVVRGITEALAFNECKTVRVAHFGSFHKRYINRRVVKNPKTGQRVEVPSYHQINFRSSKNFKDAANAGVMSNAELLEEADA